MKQFVDVLKGKCVREVLGTLLKHPEESESMEELEVPYFSELISSKLACVSKILGLRASIGMEKDLKDGIDMFLLLKILG